jgi:membrane dipeptidase
MRRRLAGIAALLALGGCASVDATHKRLLTLDTHLDTSVHFGREGWSFGERHDASTEVAQLDIARMADGNLDGGFFTIYTAQGPLTAEGYAAARAFAFKRSSEIDTTVARFSDRMGLALRAADAPQIDAMGKLVAFKSIENSYPLGDSVELLADFQRQGVRLACPVHSKNNQFADSATDKPRWHGLSALGRDWVAAMNRLGMVIDPSHASDAAFDQMLALSKTPLLLSHSGPRAKFDHARNLDDERIRKLAAAGGAICFSTIYLSEMQMGPERAALFAKIGKISTLSPAEQADLGARWHALDKTTPMWTTTFEQYIDALLHTIAVAGVDHVCFGADFDGGGGIDGVENVEALPRITARLKAAGYSDADLAKMWSGNILRILDAAERHTRAPAD